MKSILIAILLMGSMLTPVWATDSKKDNPPTYEVKITVTYNSVTKLEAAEIVRKTMEDHEKSCGLSVTVKKNNNNNVLDIGYASPTVIFSNRTPDPEGMERMTLTR